MVASYLHRRPSTRQVRLFSIAGEYAKALDLCVMHSIHLSEEVAEKMCPERSEILSEQDESQKNLLLKVAKVLKRQGNYHLASKKYTQAGDKVKAMKCLLKSGDTQKICYFAGVSRNRDIYILAANCPSALEQRVAATAAVACRR